jgi:hypothetical protein
MSVTTEAVNGPLALIPNASVWPLGKEVFYVATAAQISAMGKASRGLKERLFPTVEDALGACTTARGDAIEVFEGYTANIDAADKWSTLGTKTNVTIHGNGTGYSRPAFTWNAATATVLMDAAGFKIKNCNLYMAGALASTTALTVAAPITVSAAGCEATDNYVNFGVDADQGVTIGVTTTAAADFFDFSRNRCYGAVAAGVLTTSFFYAVGADYLKMWDTVIDGATSSTTVGTLRFITTASLGIDIRRCFIKNTVAASVHAVTQMDGVLGVVQDCRFGILDDATKAGWVPANAGNGPQHAVNFTVNLAAENGTSMTPIST